MIRIEIDKTTFAKFEAFAEFDALMELYAAECAIHGLPHPKGKWEAYHALEHVGALHTFVATVDAKLVGFITVLLPILLHYSAVVAVTESFFVSPDARNSRAGMMLLNTAEHFAEDQNALGLLVTAPIDSQLEKILDGLKRYRPTNRVFFTNFKR